ncbi:MAG: GerW family sporulation protein, partial [bacterium]
MENNTIEKLMDTAMSKIKDMVEVNTIVGDPVETIDGTVIIPVSKVSFGFAAGGGNSNNSSDEENKEEADGFAGGTGGGVMLNPMAFLVVSQEKVRLLPVTKNATVERLINMAPEIMDQIKTIIEE